MDKPQLTIIMPSHNSERFIAAAIDSVIAQSVTDWELIIVDGASSDSTHAIATSYERMDTRIHLIVPTADHGVAHARNIGLDSACGDYIAFLDSDDVWYPEKTRIQIDAIEKAQADISYTAYWRVSDRSLTRRLVTVPKRVTYGTMLRRDLIGTSTAMIRRSTCGAMRMPHLRVAEDHAYWLGLLRDATRVTIGVGEPLAEYRVRSDSLSANKLVSARHAWKLRRQIEQLGPLKSTWFFSGYVYDSLRLRLFPRRHKS